MTESRAMDDDALGHGATLMVAACAGLLHVGVPHRVLLWLSYALALGLTGRAVGEFRYVGLFKHFADRHSRDWTR